VIVGSQPDIFIEIIEQFRDLGFEKIIIHNVNKDQGSFIDFFGKEVIPSFNN